MVFESESRSSRSTAAGAVSCDEEIELLLRHTEDLPEPIGTHSLEADSLRKEYGMVAGNSEPSQVESVIIAYYYALCFAVLALSSAVFLCPVSRLSSGSGRFTLARPDANYGI
jgi:hypothetical protein